MFRKIKINNEIKRKIEEIDEYEKKRYRSQAALVEAILKSESPKDEDVDYFNNYTTKIDELRSQIHELKSELSMMDKNN